MRDLILYWNDFVWVEIEVSPSCATYHHIPPPRLAEMHMQHSHLTPVTTTHHQEYFRHAPHTVVGVIFKFIFFGFPGLPDGLPDAVCPAAMLQHVFRPPQQQWETNAAVHRPLAPPPAPEHAKHALFCRLTPSTRDTFAVIIKESWGWWIWRRKELGSEENDTHLSVFPVCAHSLDGGIKERDCPVKGQSTHRFR